VQVDVQPGVGQRLAHEHHVGWVVFDDEDADGAYAHSVILLLIVSAAAGGKVKENVGPGAAAVCDSTRMRPPWRATISLQIFSPMTMVGHLVVKCSNSVTPLAVACHK